MSVDRFDLHTHDAFSMDHGIPLGRRFRALKLWFVLRAFGREGLAARLRAHLDLARRFAAWIDTNPLFGSLARSSKAAGRRHTTRPFHQSRRSCVDSALVQASGPYWPAR